MNLSSPEGKRWVIDRIHPDAVRYTKALAAEHNLRIADVVAAAVRDLWDAVNNGDDTGPYWNAVRRD